MAEKDFICSDSFESSGIVEWNSPSNIAVVKYWGKKPNQIPQNPSISFTLSKCYTNTVVEFKPKKNTQNEINEKNKELYIGFCCMGYDVCLSTSN